MLWVHAVGARRVRGVALARVPRASQLGALLRQLGLPESRVNPNGGALALGHPLGASGARLVGTLLRELARSDGRWGLATICVGGGMGAAMVLERPPRRSP